MKIQFQEPCQYVLTAEMDLIRDVFYFLNHHGIEYIIKNCDGIVIDKKDLKMLLIAIIDNIS